MEFQSIYDEDLSQNKFFQKIQCEHKILIETAPLENWIICVPRSATIKSENLNDTDFLLAHVLVPHDEITEQYTNLLATDIKQIDGKLVSRNIVSSILFEEVYYAKGLIKYKVWCIEVPLLFSSSSSDGNGPNDYCVDASEPPAGLCIVRGLTDAVALIWNETNSKTVFRKIENICCSFMRNTNCTSQLMLDPSMLSDDTNTQNREKDLQRIKRSVEILFNHCFKKLMYQRRLHEKCVRDAHFRRVFKIALETYIMDILYRWIFDAITLCYVNETETFNTTLRNLSDANLKHFKIDRCNDIIGRVRTELLQINNYTTPIEKLSCLRRAMTAASQCKQNDISVDDLIPILVFVIVKSGLTHWITTLQFLKNFIFTEFSDGSDKGVDSFLITTLEAAIIYIKSIDLNEFRANAAVCDSDAEFVDTHKCVRRFSNKEQFIEYLFAKIRSGDEVEIVKLLKIDKNVEIATGNDDDNDTDIIVINNKSIDDGKHDCDDDDDDEGVANDIDIIAEFPLCRVNLQNMHGIGAIHVAAMNGLPKMLNVLLALGVDPETRDENNFTALHYAAARGHQSTLLLLLHAGADVTAVTNDKNTALHLCCLNGHLSCVKALLYYSAHMKVKIDRNAQNRMGDTAIHMAAKWGFRDIVEVLLEYVVKTDVENRIGETALECAHNSHIAAMLQNAFIVIDTTENGRWEDASYMASTTALNHQEVFRGCFTSSVSIDETAKEAFNNKTQNDKIVAAIRHDDVKLAYHFLGIELPEETMPAICHPLCDCPKCKRISMQLQNRCDSRQLMQMYDGNIDECSADGVTILQAAIQKQHIELIAAILKLNAKVSPQAKSTLQTALHFAMLTKSATILDLVLTHADDDDVDIQDVNGDTALHLAVKLNDIHLVDCLLKHEPNVRLRNNDGKTPADIARSMLHVNTVRLLDIADNASRCENENVE